MEATVASVLPGTPYRIPYLRLNFGRRGGGSGMLSCEVALVTVAMSQLRDQ